MSLQILIGGLDYTPYVDLSTVEVDSNLAVNSDTAQMNIIIPSQVLPYPKGGQEIIIKNGSSIEFAGVVLKPAEDMLSPDRMQYTVQFRDYLYWFNKRLVVEQYNNMTAGAIVLDIIQNCTTGFTGNHVSGTDSTFTITNIKFDHLQPSDALQKIADAVGFSWWVDYAKDVHFGPLNSVPSPLSNNTLLADTDLSSYGDLHIEEDVSQVRNQIYLLGHKIAAQYSIEQKFSCDGNATSFNLNYQPQSDITKMTVKTGLNGVWTTYTVKKDLVDGNPSSTTNDGCAYVHQDNQTVRFNVAPPSGQTLYVWYYPRYEMVNMYNDPNAMDVMQSRDKMDGVYEWSERDQQLSGDDSTLADTRGKIDLTKYAYPHYSLTFYSYLQGWRTGQFFYLTSNNRMDGIFQLTPFYINKIKKTIVNHPVNGTPTFRYDISAADSQYVY